MHGRSGAGLFRALAGGLSLLLAAGALAVVAAPAQADDDGTAVLHAIGTISIAVRDTADETGVVNDDHDTVFMTDGGAAFSFTGDAGDVSGALDATFTIPADLAAAVGVAPDATVEADSADGAAVIAAATAPFQLISAAGPPAGRSLRSSGPSAQDAQDTTPQNHVIDVAIVSDGSGHLPSPSTIQSDVAAVGAYWADGTNGELTGLTMNSTVASYTSSLACSSGEIQFVNQAAQHFGHSSSAAYQPDSPTYAFGSGVPHHLLVITPYDCQSSLSWGLADVWSNGAYSAGWLTMPARDNEYTPTITHEFGHNIGLDHSEAVDLDCDGSTLWLEPTCDSVHYGDPYSPMTEDFLASSTHSYGVPELDAAHRAYFGFPSGYLEEATAGTATYTLNSIESGSGVRAIHIAEPGTGRQLYIEYRDGSGADANAFFMTNNGHVSIIPDPNGNGAATWNLCGEPSASCTAGYGLGTGVRVVEAVDACQAGVPDSSCVPGLTYDHYSFDTPVVTNATYPAFREMAEEAGEQFISTSQQVHISVTSTSGGVATLQVSIVAPFDSTPSALNVSGTVQTGQTLTASLAGSWSPSPDAVGYQWFANGSPISGATGATLHLGSGGAYDGQRITVAATATRSDRFPSTVTSAQTAAVAAHPFTSVPTATASIARSVVTATLAGSWSPSSPIALGYQWGVGGSVVHTDTVNSFSASAGYGGQTLAERVCATSADWSTTCTAWSNGVAVPTQWSNYVTQGFLDFLDRAPTSADLAYWLPRLPAQLGSFVQTLSESDEYIGDVVTGYCTSILHRTPDPSGLAGWITAIRSGSSPIFVADSFYASDEYYAGAGGTDTAWLSALYQGIVGRTPDQAGLNGWLAVLHSGYGRTFVVDSFYQSPEKLEQRITELYRSLLGREPDPVGLAGWQAPLAAQGDIVLAATLAESAEYFADAQIAH